MTPDPSTAEPLSSKTGRDVPAGAGSPRPGLLCHICGQAINPELRDMVVFATPTTVAYLVCLFAAT